jgi:hypothetical protein
MMRFCSCSEFPKRGDTVNLRRTGSRSDSFHFVRGRKFMESRLIGKGDNVLIEASFGHNDALKLRQASMANLPKQLSKSEADQGANVASVKI